jgi:hypothetical protein
MHYFPTLVLKHFVVAISLSFFFVFCFLLYKIVDCLYFFFYVFLFRKNLIKKSSINI